MELKMITFFLFFVTLFSLFETVDSYAEKIHAVRINKAQAIVDSDKRNELTAYLVSENGSGGVIVAPVESPKSGVIKSICAKERRELPDIGSLAGKKSGIEPRVIFEDEIVNLPPEAWITFDINQSGATEIHTHSVGSIFC